MLRLEDIPYIIFLIFLTIMVHKVSKSFDASISGDRINK